MSRPSISIIGGASLDILHFQGRTEHSAGGAGLYTALAAARAGAEVTMFAPRPEPMPPELAPAAARMGWIGPIIPPEELPSFEIAHYGAGRAELINARWGAEALLTVGNLPADGLPGDIVYSGPLADPARQLAFVRHFKQLGRRTAAGTYWRAVSGHTEIVQALLAEADIFFCNEREAEGLFGGVEAARTPPGKLLFITRAERGALVIQGESRTEIPGVEAVELDPTGAGDTFCGAALALLAQGWHPAQAARQAVASAAQMIGQVGPAGLFEPMPDSPSDPRVRLNEDRIERVARLIAELGEAEPFAFVGQDFPPVGHPAVLDFFFASTLQQFGFWTAADGRYQHPMIAPLGGRMLKGSDYIWAVYQRWLGQDASGLTPQAQAALSDATMAPHFRADDGANPMPAFDLTVQQARAYGRDMTALGWAPAALVESANAAAAPLSAFLTRLDQVTGYKEDPLRKKSTLLAIILQQRPEHFLRIDLAEVTPPIIDYHLQRSCLRIGLVEVLDPALRARLIGRELLAAEDEWAVRRACFSAIERVQRLSGKSMGAVDWFFFGARRRCPEMTEPECASCPVDPVCGHHKELFQPVIRTAFY